LLFHRRGLERAEPVVSEPRESETPVVQVDHGHAGQIVIRPLFVEDLRSAAGCDGSPILMGSEHIRIQGAI